MCWIFQKRILPTPVATQWLPKIQLVKVSLLVYWRCKVSCFYLHAVQWLPLYNLLLIYLVCSTLFAINRESTILSFSSEPEHRYPTPVKEVHHHELTMRIESLKQEPLPSPASPEPKPERPQFSQVITISNITGHFISDKTYSTKYFGYLSGLFQKPVVPVFWPGVLSAPYTWFINLDILITIGADRRWPSRADCWSLGQSTAIHSLVPQRATHWRGTAMSDYASWATSGSAGSASTTPGADDWAVNYRWDVKGRCWTIHVCCGKWCRTGWNRMQPAYSTKTWVS